MSNRFILRYNTNDIVSQCTIITITHDGTSSCQLSCYTHQLVNFTEPKQRQLVHCVKILAKTCERTELANHSQYDRNTSINFLLRQIIFIKWIPF